MITKNVVKLRFPVFNSFHKYMYMYKIEKEKQLKTFSYIYEIEDQDIDQLPFSTIFNSTEASVPALLSYFDLRRNQLNSVANKDDTLFINNGANYPPLFEDILIQYNENSFIKKLKFSDLIEAKCYDRLSSIQSSVLFGLNIGDGWCAVEKSEPENTEKISIIDEIIDFEDEDEEELITYNRGFGYSQGIVHNLYFKFVTYIFSNQITTMTFNHFSPCHEILTSCNSRQVKKEDMSNTLIMNKNHLKPLRKLWYPRGQKEIFPSLIETFNNIMLAFWMMDDGYFQITAASIIFNTQGFDEASVGILIDCLKRIEYKTSIKKDTGRSGRNGLKQFIIELSGDDYGKFIRTFTELPYSVFIARFMKYKFDVTPVGPFSHRFIRSNFWCNKMDYYLWNDKSAKLVCRKTHNSQIIYYCVICEKKVNAHHSHVLNSQCPKCKVFFTESKNAEKHFNNCDGTKTIKCKMCFMKVCNHTEAKERHNAEHAKSFIYIAL